VWSETIEEVKKGKWFEREQVIGVLSNGGHFAVACYRLLASFLNGGLKTVCFKKHLKVIR
jgi:hypothetical protein